MDEIITQDTEEIKTGVNTDSQSEPVVAAEAAAEESIPAAPQIPPQSYYQYNPQAETAIPEPVQPSGKGLAIAGMVCGIVSLVLVCCFWPIGVVCAVVGLVLSIIALVKKQNTGMSVAGIITSGVGILLTAVLFIVSALFMSSLSEAINDPVFRERLEQEFESQGLEEEFESLFEE